MNSAGHGEKHEGGVRKYRALIARRERFGRLPAFCSGSIALGDSIVAINGELVSAGKEEIIQETVSSPSILSRRFPDSLQTQRLLSGTPGTAFEITFEAFDGIRRNTTLLHVAEEIFLSSQRVEEQGLRVSTGIVVEACDELKDVSWAVDQILPGSSAYFSQKVTGV